MYALFFRYPLFVFLLKVLATQYCIHGSYFKCVDK